MMKGIVTKWIPNKSCGFIIGEDGNAYFTHKSEVTNAKDLHLGNFVRFDSKNDGGATLRAVNVVKTGHGRRHPFASELRQIIKSLQNGEVTDEVVRASIIKKLETIEHYFCEVEDFEWCNDPVHRFHIKESEKEGA